MRHRLEYLVVRLVFAVVRALPDPLARGIGSVIGWAFYTFGRAGRSPSRTWRWRFRAGPSANVAPSRAPRSRTSDVCSSSS
jgi:hypothetical protein